MVILSPFLVFWLLLAGAAVTAALSVFRPRINRQTAVVVHLLALLSWLLLRGRIPWTPTVDTASPWRWQLDEMAWQVSVVLLWLGLVVQIHGLRPAVKDDRVAAAALLFTAIGLLAVWAGAPATVLLAWTLLLALGVAAFWLWGGEIADPPWLLVGPYLLAWLFLWLAAAAAPEAGRNGWQMAAWPQAATSSLLTAALLQMGIWPFQGKRPFFVQMPTGVLLLIQVTPAIAGLTILGRVVAGSGVSLGYSLFLTAFGLLGVMRAVRLAGMHLQRPRRISAALTTALVHLALLAVVWTGAGVLPTEARVVALVAAVLFLAPLPVSREKWQRGIVLAPLAAALLALAGWPLTAAFAGRGGLYAVWLEDGRWLLVLVAVLLQLPLATQFFSLATSRADKSDAGTGTEGFWALAPLAAALLAAIGVLSPSGLSPLTAVVGAALLLPVVGGWLLFQFAGGGEEWRQALQKAFAIRWPEATLADLWQLGWARLETAVNAAFAILEGEGGMLWILVFVVLLLVVG